MSTARRVRTGLRVAAPALLAAAVALAAAGCARPRPGGPIRSGVADLAKLVQAHPGWERVQDLDAKIARLSGAAPAASAPLFVPLPPPHLEGVELNLPAIEKEQRQRMAQVIEQRVARDFEARSGHLRRQAQRSERTAVANATTEVEDRIAREREQFERAYDATAHGYGNTLGSLKLRELELHPSPLDRVFFPEPAIAQLDADRRRVGGRLAEVREQRDAELSALQREHRAKLAQMRESAIARARQTSQTEALAALGELEGRRRTQQEQLETDLERALQPQTELTPAPIRPIPGERPKSTRQASHLGQLAAATLQEQHGAQAAAVAQLRRHRGELAALVEAAARAAAQEVAAEHRIAVSFNGHRADARLTAWLADQLHERWGTAPAVSRSDPG